MKIVTIVGARPQFVKAAALSRVIKQHAHINEIIIHTGQHYDQNMSAIFFDEMDIPVPHYNLGINGKSHGAMTGQMLEKIEEVLLQEKPDWVLVYGDTNSTIAGALAAKKMHIKVAHVEAGLRSFNMAMPEEVNRILTDRISDCLLCPTRTAIKNLKKEGYDNLSCTVKQVGDIMYDAALFYTAKMEAPTMALPKRFALATVHRAENTDDIDRLKGIFSALDELSNDLPVVLPLHPRTKKRLEQYNLSYQNIVFIEPVGYLTMIWLLSKCQIVLTDSGGLQKEAYFFKKPCVTMRDETEWVELVEEGFNILTGADKTAILQAVKTSLAATFDFDKALYGKGDTAQQILDTLALYTEQQQQAHPVTA